ncbi:hypothetical protein HYW21_04795 [Candidatus Woesearchaeota archaeon]|nr:hypothetical protein [Candidatus Woesearchaeota archaeon]
MQHIRVYQKLIEGHPDESSQSQPLVGSLVIQLPLSARKSRFDNIPEIHTANTSGLMATLDTLLEQYPDAQVINGPSAASGIPTLITFRVSKQPANNFYFPWKADGTGDVVVGNYLSGVGYTSDTIAGIYGPITRVSMDPLPENLFNDLVPRERRHRANPFLRY